MSANARQVGGAHYQTGATQHWDLLHPEYHIGNATKYLSRWRKKNGLQDLEKASHYIEKLLEGAGLDWSFGDLQNRDLVRFVRWVAEAQLTGWEAEACFRLMFATDIAHLVRARDLVHALMLEARTAPAPKRKAKRK